MASKVVVPESFSGKGSVDVEFCNWFRRFEYCAAANGWDGEVRLARLPTLLKGLGFAKFELPTENERDT